MAPSYNHAYLQAKLIGALLKFEKYSVFSELTLTIDKNDYVPDICVYPARPINWLHDITKMSEMPLLAIEILSPSQGTQAVIDKFGIYFQAGIKSCWLVAPVTNAVIVFSSYEEGKTFTDGEIIDNELKIKIPIKNIF